MDRGFFGTWGVLFYTNLVAVLVEKFFALCGWDIFGCFVHACPGLWRFV